VYQYVSILERVGRSCKLAKAGMAIMLLTIFVVNYFPEPMVLMAGLFLIGLLLYLLDR
jgi:hypothetical protein